MEHAKDSTGSEMYSKFYMKYRDPQKADKPEEQQWTEFITDGFDEAYQDVLAELKQKDKEYNLSNGNDANGNGIEDEDEEWMHRYVGSLRQAENPDGSLKYATSEQDSESYPLYTAGGAVHAKDSNGNYIYEGSQGELFTSEYTYEELTGSNNPAIREEFESLISAHNLITPSIVIPRAP